MSLEQSMEIAELETVDNESDSSKDGQSWSSGSTVFEEKAWWRIVSIQSVIALLMLLGIVLSVASSEFLGERACDAALDDTRASTTASTSLLGSAATDSLEKIATELLGYSAVGTTGMIRSFLTAGLDQTRGLQQINLVHLRDTPRNSSAWEQKAAALQWDQITTMPATSPVLLIGTVANYTASIHYLQHPNHPKVQENTVPCYSVVMNDWDSSAAQLGSAEPISGVIYRGDPVNHPVLPMIKKVRDVVGLTVINAFYRVGETKFTGVIVPIAGFIGVSVGMKLPDPTGSLPSVDCIVFMHLGFIDTFLRGIVEKAIDNRPSAKPRVFITVASTWIAGAMKSVGNPNWAAYDQTNYLAGVSNGVGTSLGDGFSDITGFPEPQHTPIRDVEASDPIIRGIAVAVNGNYSSFESKYRMVEISTPNGTEEHYVGTQHLTLPGLDLWIVLSLDSDSVFGDVPQALLDVATTIENDNDRVADTIASDRMNSRFIIIGIGAALVLVSFVLSYIVTRPIKNLQRQMRLVANLDLAGLDLDSNSMFFELRRMQSDFCRMVHHLIEFRAYVPSAVLEAGGDASRAIVEPPTGNVAIVFTDIRGSSELWHANPGDMNKAMEVHNEVMREACVANGGYEVKTIGDAFMVSFQCPKTAVHFALDVQSNLCKAAWPPGLALPEAGLVVRIGINCGSTIAEQNPVTGRIDYRGDAVNLASRVEGKATPGTICITSDMYAAVRTQLPGLGSAVQNFGVHEVKGLGGGHELYLLAPEHLKRRFSEKETDCAAPVQSPAVHLSESYLLASSGRHNSVVITKSDEGSQSSRKAGVPKKMGKTALQITRGNVTVAVCRLNDVKFESQLFDNANIMVRSAVEAALTSEGILMAVTGRTLTVVWNASKKCQRHVTSAVAFASSISKLKDMLQVGLATGPMLHGNIGTKTSRFSTIFGLPLEAAEAMSDYTQTFGVYCLYADCSTDTRLQSEAALRPCLRLVDKWRESGRMARLVRIYELQLEHLNAAVDMWVGADVPNTTSVDLERHTRIIEKAMEDQEGLCNLAKLLAEQPNDSVLRKVFQLLDASKPTGGHRVLVKFSRVPKAADADPPTEISFNLPPDRGVGGN